MSQLASPPRTDFSHIPLTLSSYLSEQHREWETLFPAERSYLDRLSRYLEKALAPMFDPLRAIEKKMGVNPANWPRGRFTLEQVDFLNRNAHYQEWRSEIARLFSQIDPILESEVVAKGRPRVVVVLSPSELPVGPDRLWTRLAGQGRRVPVAVPDDPSHYLGILLTGEPDASRGRCVADIGNERGSYASWTIETGEAVGATCRDPRTVRLSYTQLSAYRRRLMTDVQKVVEDPAVKGPRQLSARLKSLKVQPAESRLSGDSVLSEFVRNTLLAGNGTLLINNTFVEWASVQALRRARPDVLLVGFGIRNKVKPFSSLLLFHDQDQATAIPTQADMLGSYVDLEVFYRYLWQEAAKQPEYRNNTAYIFSAVGMDEIHLIAPLDFPLEPPSSGSRTPLAEVYGAMRRWLGA
jgi:hypothetical protein